MRGPAADSARLPPPEYRHDRGGEADVLSETLSARSARTGLPGGHHRVGANDRRLPRLRLPAHAQSARSIEIVLAPGHGHLLQLPMIFRSFPSRYSAHRSYVAGLLVGWVET